MEWFRSVVLAISPSPRSILGKIRKIRSKLGVKAWLPKAWLPKAWLPKAWLPKARLPKAWLPKAWCQRQGEKQGPNTLL
jgi:hypothetical protein